MLWGEHPYYAYSYYLKQLYGEKVYKISLNPGFTCPNRDGTLDTRGCIFCSAGGSGDFASSSEVSITEQIELGKRLLSNKAVGKKYIAYFQAFTNTYAPIQQLEKVFFEAITHHDIVGLSIATRPDCLDERVLSLLMKLNTIKKVWVELGLQTIHEKTAHFIRRGYDLDCFENALQNLEKINIDPVIHLILGLPFETKDDIYKSIDYLNRQPISGVKLQLLHVLKNTDLATLYQQGAFETLSQDVYCELVTDCIERIRQDIVIHRITGDGPKKLLIAPTWSGNKKAVLNQIIQTFKKRQTFQGKFY